MALSWFGVARGQDDPRPLGDKNLSRRPPQPPAAARDHEHAVGQSEVHRVASGAVAVEVSLVQGTWAVGVLIGCRSQRVGRLVGRARVSREVSRLSRRSSAR